MDPGIIIIVIAFVLFWVTLFVTLYLLVQSKNKNLPQDSQLTILNADTSSYMYSALAAVIVLLLCLAIGFGILWKVKKNKTPKLTLNPALQYDVSKMKKMQGEEGTEGKEGKKEVDVKVVGAEA